MQMAFICARQLYPVEIDPDSFYYDEIMDILANVPLNSFFITFAREASSWICCLNSYTNWYRICFPQLDILEPKSPEEVYKTWLEPVPPRFSLLGDTHMDSARQNLASSLVNGFVNAGFCSDKLLTVDGGNRWIYRLKSFIRYMIFLRKLEQTIIFPNIPETRNTLSSALLPPWECFIYGTWTEA